MGQPPTALQMSLELRTFRAGPETGHVPDNQGAAGHGRPGSRLQADPAGTAESPLELVEQVLARILQHRVQPWVWLKSQIKHEDRSNETEDSPEVSLCS